MSREEVLGDIRAALGRDREGPVGPAVAPSGGLPERPDLEGDRVDRFRRELEAVSGFVLEAGREWEETVQDFVEQEGLVGVYAPGFDSLDGMRRVDEERARDEPERVLGLAPGSWGVAASGSVVLEGTPLLPVVLVETSLVVLKAGNVVARLADLPEPRGRRLVATGPSRTADIEKKIVLGAHGPKRFGVVFVR